MRRKKLRDDQIEQADCSASSLARLSITADSSHHILAHSGKVSGKTSLSLYDGNPDDSPAICCAGSPGGTAEEAIPAGRVSSQCKLSISINPCRLLAEHGKGAEKHLSASAAYGN
ncbi:hypothetical protein ANOM_007726 [Aspergillus nomiae NRRL 13137]|uniref:Uncharacterized protein n=1 Tax=Aspergillus nomiae NRRL (strain ATCC 15546 / NRRL 13137 / CBS 260.88 / M93) TaxID=1509407 RepID=A0A0L1IZW5_ASPN3|nr:uncharacterized protein ANOM_007726 [Aspergillus nomiae NRRL 13137]KNG85032.1 hypothetical protein ANOM_007726 [Aspergillus nomiae NRRL 13137]